MSVRSIFPCPLTTTDLAEVILMIFVFFWDLSLAIITAESPNLKQWSTPKVNSYVLSEASINSILFILYVGEIL